MAASKAPLYRLRHIVDEAEAIRETTRGIQFEEFKKSWLIRRAVEHGLLIIAEAANTLPAELKATQPEIPWAQIVSFGNLLRHEYRDVNPTIVWKIVHEDLPKLKTAAEEMLAKLTR
jgi:uncharacterized protein with HEPN domain